MVRRRIGWLLLLFVAETMTGTVLRHYESELAAVVALSFFIPLLIGTGGNAGAQTVTTIIRGLALKEIRRRDAWRVLGREAGAGVTIGVLLGAFALGRALLWGAHMPLAATVAITILAICSWSTTVGSLVPLLADRLGHRPGGAVGAVDHDTGGRDGAGDLLLDREGDPGAVSLVVVGR